MLTLREGEDRGHTDLGWLNSYHTFSFGAITIRSTWGFVRLRVLNDDRVAAGKGFGAHGHRDMEILSYVLEGGLAHKDSMGEQHVLGPNEVQAMSAGSGVIHSEFNASGPQPTHFFRSGSCPRSRTPDRPISSSRIPPSEKRGTLRLIAGPDRTANPPAAFINQDARCTRPCSARVIRSITPIRAGPPRVGAVRDRRDRRQRPCAQRRRRAGGQR